MTNDRGPSATSIFFEYLFEEPPPLVWRALTEPDLLALWLMPNNIRAEVGATFTFRAEATPWWDGIVHCEVLEVKENERLVYTWLGSPQGQGANALDTEVRWTLRPTEQGGTKLLLEHSGFEPESFVFKAMGSGWSSKIASRMRDVIHNIK
jgi:uncharacterized protein YndB with AHSA1/START domain